MFSSFKEVNKMASIINADFESNFVNRIERIFKKFFCIRKSDINEIFVNSSTYIFLKLFSNMIFTTIIGYRKVV